MTTFDIPPHPKRTTRLALGLVGLAAAAAFTEGFLRQLDHDRPPPPPKPAPGFAAIAEATPAPVPALQTVSPVVRKKAAPSDTEDSPLLNVPAMATQPAATDAVATAPDTSPAPAAPAPTTPPASDEAPT